MYQRFILLQVTAIILSGCSLLPVYDYGNINIADSIFSELSALLSLGIILLPLTRHLLVRAGRIPTLAIKINSITFGVVVLLWIPQVVIDKYLYLTQLSSRYYFSNQTLSNASLKLDATYYFLYFVAATIGSFILIGALVKGSGKDLVGKVSTLIVSYSLSLI
jgi:hypothetical protein